MRYLEGTIPPWPTWSWGAHWVPHGSGATYWEDAQRRASDLSLLRECGIRWVTVLTDPGEGDLNRIVGGKEYARWWLDNQIVPIVRVDGPWDEPMGGLDTLTRNLVRVWADYGMKPILIPGNEAGDAREWEAGTVPKDWLARSVSIWKQRAQEILNAGGRVLFPDPLGFYKEMWGLLADRAGWFNDGLAGFAGHFYGLGRPPAYPFDQPDPDAPWAITQEEWETALDDLVDHPHFRELTPEIINAARDKWRSLQDPNALANCFNAWMSARHWAGASAGIDDLCLCMTEGGWTTRDAPWGECRYPHTTPKAIARNTLAIFQSQAHGMFAMTPWIWEDTRGIWYTQCWRTGAYSDVIDRDTGEPYGYDKPVIRTLRAARKPGEEPPARDWAAIMAHVEDIREALIP